MYLVGEMNLVSWIAIASRIPKYICYGQPLLGIEDIGVKAIYFFYEQKYFFI